MSDCLFCKIINGEIPSEKVFENDMVYAFRDIEPQAPEHIVIVPKKLIGKKYSISGLCKSSRYSILHLFGKFIYIGG